jgi:hypothetical protein
MCIDNLLGLSPTAIGCFTDAPPNGYSESDLGYYVNDADYGIGIGSRATVAGWAILERAKNAALNELKSDLQMALRERFKATFVNVNDWVGGSTLGSAETGLITYGWKIKPTREHKDLVLHIDMVRLATYAGCGVRMQIFKNGTRLDVSATTGATSREVAPAFMFELQSGANVWNTNVLSDVINLPLYDATEPDLEYTLVFAGCAPINNNLACCGKSHAASMYIDVVAGRCNADSSGFSALNGALGVSMFMRVTCSDLGWICGLQKMGDYSTLNVIGRLWQARAAALAIGEFIATDQINISSLYNAEQLQARKNELNKNYGGWLSWVVENMPDNISQCWKCTKSLSVQKIEFLI